MRENSVEEDPSSPRRGPEQVVNLLREVEVEVANGKTPLQACRDAGIHTQTYYRWRKGFGGLKLDPAKRLAADLPLEKQVLRDETSIPHKGT